MGVLLLNSGCFLVPAPYAGQLNPVARRYRVFKSGALRADFAAQLGKPSAEEKDGPCVWETRVDAVNYVKLEAWFDAAGKATRVVLTRAHGEITPNSTTSAVVKRGT